MAKELIFIHFTKRYVKKSLIYASSVHVKMHWYIETQVAKRSYCVQLCVFT